MKKQITKFCIIFFVIVCNFQLINATEFVYDGYIITNDSNKIKGYIYFFNDSKTPDYILFTSTYNGQLIKYFPSDILEFGFQQQRFISAEVDVNISSETLNTMTEEIKPEIVRKRIFLQIMLEGAKNLYQYKTPFHPSKTLYYIGNRNNPVLLLRNFYKKTSNNKIYKMQYLEYKNQLIRYFYNDTTISLVQPEKLQYSFDSMYEIFNKYYIRSNKQPDFINNLRKTNNYFYIYTGMNVNFYQNISEQYFISTANVPLAPVLGFGIGFNSKKHLWNTHLDVFYSGWGRFYKYTNDFIYPERYDEYTNNSNFHMFTIDYYFHNAIRQKYGELFYNAGIHLTNYICYNSTKIYHHKFYSDEYTRNLNSYDVPGEGKFLLGGGIQIKNYSAELRYYPGFPNYKNNIVNNGKLMLMIAVHL